MSFEYSIAACCNKKTDSTLMRYRGTAKSPAVFGVMRPGFGVQPGDAFPGQATLWGSSLPSATLLRAPALGSSQNASSTTGSNAYRGFAAVGSPRNARGEINTVNGFHLSKPNRLASSSLSSDEQTSAHMLPDKNETPRYACRPQTRNPINGVLNNAHVDDERDWSTTHRCHFDPTIIATGRPAETHVPTDLSPEVIPRGRFGPMPWSGFVHPKS